MKLKSLLISLSLSACLTAQADETRQPEFYVFQNGLPKLSYKEEANLLKELGYDGVSQVYEGGAKLADRIEAYQMKGLKVLSIYLTAKETPVDPEIYKPLAKSGGMIELTVREEITPALIESIRTTAETAKGMNVRVALYPHHGFTVETMPQAIALADKVNHPNLGIMFNLCHFLMNENEQDLEVVLERASPRLFSVSTCGADIDGDDWTTLIMTLGQGTFPQKRLLNALKTIGYEGPITLQSYKIKGNKRTNLERSISAWRKIQ